MKRVISLIILLCVFLYAGDNIVSPVENKLNGYVKQLNMYEEQFKALKQLSYYDTDKIQQLTQNINKTLSNYQQTVKSIENNEIAKYKNILNSNVKEITDKYKNQIKTQAAQLISPFNSDLKYFKDNVNAVKQKYLFAINDINQIKQLKNRIQNTLTAFKDMKNYIGLIKNYKNILSLKITQPTDIVSTNDLKITSTVENEVYTQLLNLKQINVITQNTYITVDGQIFELQKLTKLITLNIVSDLTDSQNTDKGTE